MSEGFRNMLGNRRKDRSSGGEEEGNVDEGVYAVAPTLLALPLPFCFIFCPGLVCHGIKWNIMGVKQVLFCL